MFGVIAEAHAITKNIFTHNVHFMKLNSHLKNHFSLIILTHKKNVTVRILFFCVNSSYLAKEQFELV